jgi:hypothetical protein
LAGLFLVLFGTTVLVANALRTLGIIGTEASILNPLTWFAASLE